MRFTFARYLTRGFTFVGLVVYSVFVFAAWVNWQQISSAKDEPLSYLLLIGVFGTGTFLVVLMVDFLVFGRNKMELMIGTLALAIGVYYHGIAMAFVAHRAGEYPALVSGEILFVLALLLWRHRRGAGRIADPPSEMRVERGQGRE